MRCPPRVRSGFVHAAAACYRARAIFEVTARIRRSGSCGADRVRQYEVRGDDHFYDEVMSAYDLGLWAGRLALIALVVAVVVWFVRRSRSR